MASQRVARSFVGLMVVGVSISAQARSSGEQTQTPPPPPVTFKTEIAYVEVSARVLDNQGNFVPNLTKDEFRVLEDGKPQRIEAFGVVRIPFERPEKPLFMERAVEPDTVSNAPAQDGRLYVLALDEFHTDPLRSQRVKEAARRFIEENLGAHDRAAVDIIGNSLASQELTSNQRLLLAEFRTLAARHDFSVIDARGTVADVFRAVRAEVGEVIRDMRTEAGLSAPDLISPGVEAPPT